MEKTISRYSKSRRETAAFLVSHDVRTMPGHFRTFIAGRESPGLILVPQKAALGRVIDDLVLLWLASDDHEWINQICYLPL